MTPKPNKKQDLETILGQITFDQLSKAVVDEQGCIHFPPAEALEPAHKIRAEKPTHVVMIASNTFDMILQAHDCSKHGANDFQLGSTLFIRDNSADNKKEKQ